MLKKTISYTDYNGVERTEDFYFNLTKAELMEWELGTEGGLSNVAQRIIDAKDQKAIINLFKELLIKAYGEKSADGRRFMKSDEISQAFTESPAYSILYMELATDDKAAANFINGIMPSDLVSQAKAQNPQLKLAASD